jgi:hypothetical protein
MIYNILYSIIGVLLLVYLYLNRNIKECMMAYNKIDKTKHKIYNYDKNCMLRCGDHNNCLRLKYRTYNYNKCKKCKKDNKYFYKDIVNYNCMDTKDKFNTDISCDYDEALSCPNHDNISSHKMIKPYYSMSTNNTGGKPVCNFCWNFN